MTNNKQNGIIAICPSGKTNITKRGDCYMLNIEQIKEIIPHRYPFLLVDKILEVDEGKRAVGIKKCIRKRRIL